MTPVAKPTKREPSKASRPMPRCACEHSHRKHLILPALGGGVGGCLYVSPEGDVCPCDKYRPARVSVRRSDPIQRKAKTKVMPKCKHCARPHRYHMGPGVLHGGGWCPGYAPAIGIRQKRRTPAAAVRRIADDLWSKLVKTSPSPDAWMAFQGCEVQRFYPHSCEMGLQAMHGIPRTFSATRWLPINGFAGCAGIHKFFTDRPEMWSAVLLDAWGEPTFRELWALARASQPVDMDATVGSLRAELARIGG